MNTTGKIDSKLSLPTKNKEKAACLYQTKCNGLPDEECLTSKKKTQVTRISDKDEIKKKFLNYFNFLI
jgi:hypothetical protein